MRFARRLAIPGDRVAQVRTIAALAKELGLQPQYARRATPEITEDDVNLVCWLAIVPAEPPTTIAEFLGELPWRQVETTIWFG